VEILEEMMRTGDVILTSSITARDRPANPNFQAGFKAPKGQAFAMLFLGATDGEDGFDPEKALNAMGWYRKDDQEGGV
jgi:hypothetical protein